MGSAAGMRSAGQLPHLPGAPWQRQLRRHLAVLPARRPAGGPPASGCARCAALRRIREWPPRLRDAARVGGGGSACSQVPAREAPHLLGLSATGGVSEEAAALRPPSPTNAPPPPPVAASGVQIPIGALGGAAGCPNSTASPASVRRCRYGWQPGLWRKSPGDPVSALIEADEGRSLLFEAADPRCALRPLAQHYIALNRVQHDASDQNKRVLEWTTQQACPAPGRAEGFWPCILGFLAPKILRP